MLCRQWSRCGVCGYLREHRQSEQVTIDRSLFEFLLGCSEATVLRLPGWEQRMNQARRIYNE